MLTSRFKSLALTLLAALTLSLSLTATAPIFAQPVMTDHVPGDALVYIGWHGQDEAAGANQKTNLRKMLKDTDIPERVMELLRRASQIEPDPDSDRALSFIDEMGPVMWQRPWAFYFSGAKMPDGEDGDPKPRMGFFINPGDNADHRETTEKWLVKFMEAAQNNDDMGSVTLIQQPDRMGLVFGGNPLGKGGEDAANQRKGRGALTNAPMLKQATSHAVDKPMLTAVADAEGLIQFVQTMSKFEEGEDEAQTQTATLKALGVDQLTQVVYSAGFEGKRWRQRTFIGTPKPRTGLASMLEGDKLTDQTLKLVSKSATWFRTIQLDGQHALAMIRETLDIQGDDMAVDDFEKGLKQANQTVGFDVEKDLIEPLGTQWLMYTDQSFGSIGGFVPGMVLINELDDGEKVKASMNKLTDWVNKQMQQNGAGMQFQEMDMGKIKVHALAFPVASPGWAVKGDRLYIAASPNAIVTADTFAEQDGSILDSKKYQTVRKRLEKMAQGDVQVQGMTFTNFPNAAMSMYQSYATLLGMLDNFAAMGGPGANNNQKQLRASDALPPLGQILPHLEPSGSMTWTDDEGYHSISTSPFPGSVLLSPDMIVTGGTGTPLFVVPFSAGFASGFMSAM